MTQACLVPYLNSTHSGCAILISCFRLCSHSQVVTPGVHPSPARQQLAEAEKAYAAIKRAAAVNAAEANADYCGLSSLETEEIKDGSPSSTKSRISRSDPSDSSVVTAEQPRQAPRRRCAAHKPIVLVSSASSLSPPNPPEAVGSSWPAHFGAQNSSCAHPMPTPSPPPTSEVATAAPSIASTTANTWGGATLRGGPRSFSAPDKCPLSSSTSPSSSLPTITRMFTEARAGAGTYTDARHSSASGNNTFVRGARASRASRLRRTLIGAHASWWCSVCQCTSRSSQSNYIKSSNFACSLSSSLKGNLENSCGCWSGNSGSCSFNRRPRNHGWLQRTSPATCEVSMPGLPSWLRIAKEWASASHHEAPIINGSALHLQSILPTMTMRDFNQEPKEMSANWPKSALFGYAAPPLALAMNYSSCYAGC